jgi:hypothetical protein
VTRITMIIRTISDSLLFITQPDHARLAADAIAHWQADGFPNHPRRDVILLAAREHDNGWIEEDAATYVDEHGNPLDFASVPVAVRQRIWPRAVDRMAERSPYAAALIAQHALTVYGTTHADPAWAEFFEVMTGRRETLLGRTGTALARLESDYAFVNAADRISLAFCTAWQTPLESFGRRIILSGQTVEITPDPFEGAQVPLRIVARRLPAGSYASGASLRNALDGAPIELLKGTAVGVP